MINSEPQHYEGTIHPTGTCFDDALDSIQKGLFERQYLDQVRIVHGLVSRTNDPEHIYAHCWLEFKNHYFETVLLEPDMERAVIQYNDEEYKALYNIHDQTKYTVYQLIEQGLKSKTRSSGPYLKKYLRKCKDYKEVRKQGLI